MANLLNGRYELGDVLGSGGMGRVHRATDTRLARAVAVKILRAGSDEDATARARFRAEAQLAGSLQHPGIAQIYDVGEDESSPERDPFIVMQLVDGTPLSQVLQQRGSLPPEEVWSIIGQVADALDAAHAAGIVHRDLKPSNIMITPVGRAVLVDFGIAWSAASAPLTLAGSVLGTAEYFSPEQASGRPATPRSDLYSLGVVAHHCLSGRSAFQRDTPIATAMAQLNDDLPPLGEEVPSALRSLIASLAQKDPDDRPANAALVASLAAAEHPVTGVLAPPLTSAPTTGPITGPVGSAPAPTPEQPTDPAAPPAGSARRPMALAAGVVILLVAVVVGVMAMDRDSGDTPRATPSATPTPTETSDGDTGGGDGGAPANPRPPGTPTTTVDADSLIGLSYADAASQLIDLGLRVVKTEEISTDPVGTVTAVDPAGRVPRGSTVTLTIAAEAPVETTPTPSVTPTPTPPTASPGDPGEPPPGGGQATTGP